MTDTRYFRFWWSDGEVSVTLFPNTREGIVEEWGEDLDDGQLEAIEELPADVKNYEDAERFEDPEVTS